MIRIIKKDYIPPKKRGSLDKSNSINALENDYHQRFELWCPPPEYELHYTNGARVWIQHAETVWQGAVLLEDYKEKAKSLRVKTEDGEVHELVIIKSDDLPPLRNPDVLIGENDLTSLSYLHEPAVLYNLQERFIRQNSIYTYCGIVLVAINPYKDLLIYGNDTIWAYRGQAMGDLEPHIFAVAEEAYTKLEREQRDQSIIVSGESGAGKTVSAKYAMRYFATVGGSSTETQVEKKVLASSPIMEAIGNAKTTRNDNSSRFGKFIQIHFNKQYHIQGASMRTYLLEKSRVVFQAPEERNYHIFYQLCASREKLPDLALVHQDEFHYLNQGESPSIDGVDDAKLFEETVKALSLLGFSKREQSDMFKILSAILHLGNIKVIQGDSGDVDAEGSAISANDSSLNAMCQLLQIDDADMRSWLCHRKIISMREVFFKPMTVTEAVSARDALAKHIYAELFNWIVTIVNKSLQSSGTSQRFIGVLDIYGFETFEINSFEQFCINYANEKLQQQFNQHVFKLEQEEYVREEIQWKRIDFYDNQPCIDLIETKLGILDLLDEECRMPKGSDQSWVEKLSSKCTKWKHFSMPRFGTSAFIIHHFADNVTYQSFGFLEKNKDTVMEDQINVLRNSQNKLVKQLFSEEEERKLHVPGTKVKVSASKPTTVTSASKQHKKTVGSQFRDSLNMLMTTLNATTPHYVRCIKPNDEKKSFVYNPARAVQQLRACGVLETIRISAAGFPSRWTYYDFFLRYRVLCKFKDIKRDDMKATCQVIINNVIKDSDKFQFGKTKIFFRGMQVAYLEKLRSEKLRHCCIIIQKQVRAFIYRAKYMRTLRAVHTIQRYARGLLARRYVHELKRTKAAITIQKYVRGWVKRVQYLRAKKCVVGLQTYSRGFLARKKFDWMRRNHNAIIIQRYVRGWLARKAYRQQYHKVVIAQSAVRRFLARRLFKKLKVEARSVEHVKKLNKGLENKIISLQQKIEELVKENNILKLSQQELLDLRAKLEVLRNLEQEKKRLSNLLTEKDQEVEKLSLSLQKERDEKMDLLNEKDRSEKEYIEKIAYINSENIELKTSLNELNETIKNTRNISEENIKARIEQEKLFLIQEHDQDRDAYQKLLADYHLMEQRNESLERELARLQRGGSGRKLHHRSPSNASTISIQDDGSIAASEQPEDDFGYGSVRSVMSSSSTSSHQRVENIDWSQQQGQRSESMSPEGQKSPSEQVESVVLVLKLQQKLKEIEKERTKLQKRVEILQKDEAPKDDKSKILDAFKVQDLEIENAKLRENLANLRIAASDGENGGQELLRQYETLQQELDRSREECVQLRSILANQTQGLKSVASNNYSSHVEIINEDGELALAFEAQKQITRQLEDELQEEKARWKSEHEEYQSEIEKLKEENEKLRKLVTANLTKGPLSQTEAFMQHEISRLTSENLDLQEKLDTLMDQCQSYKKEVKELTRKLKDAGLWDSNSGVAQTAPTPAPCSSAIAVTTVANIKAEKRNSLPVVRKKDRDYQGMFEYRMEDVPEIVLRLIHNLKPRVAVTLLPGLPAYIIFMCIRHTDNMNDDEKVRSFLTSIINMIRKVLKKRPDDLETSVLWLANTLRLLHNLKQYSGEASFKEKNTPKQNEQCLRNFDLTEYRTVLSDMAVWIYQNVTHVLAERFLPLIIPAILEHEAIFGLSNQKPSGMRGRASSVGRESLAAVDAQKALDLLVQELSNVHKILSFHGVDPDVIIQIFRQLFYYICASALNNLLLRKDLCHWKAGMQIRYNLSHLEQWARDQKIQVKDTNVLETLQPIIQASQLLQARKTDKDVDTVCEMCDKLSLGQIIKILNLYTPADECEERVPVSFMRNVQAKLKERKDFHEEETLLMNLKFTFPVRFTFSPSNIRLEDIEIPEVLNIPMLKKL